jgi:cytidyltransferase-like protein
MEATMYAIFGGSFNPPTIAHISIAIELLKEKNIEKVIFVPVGNQYKKNDLIDVKHRMDMLKQYFEDNSELEISDIFAKTDETLETIDFFDLSAREVIILLRNVNIAQEIVNPHHLAICKVALFILFSVKYKKPQLYMDIFKGEEIKAGEVQVTSDNYIYTFLNFIATIANEYTFDVINKLSDLDKQRNNTPWMNSVIEFLYRVSIPASTKEKYGEALRRYLEIYAPVV